MVRCIVEGVGFELESAIVVLVIEELAVVGVREVGVVVEVVAVVELGEAESPNEAQLRHLLLTSTWCGRGRCTCSAQGRCPIVSFVYS